LTDRERELLAILTERPGETIPREAIAGDDLVSDRTVDVQINRLRRKIEEDPSNPVHLQTVRGLGYRLLVD
jgi:two-component system phosphate regulon response regulator OmpR